MTLSSSRSNRSAAASRTIATFRLVARSVPWLTIGRPRESNWGRKPTMSASRAAKRRIRGPPPPMMIGGCGRWTGVGAIRARSRPVVGPRVGHQLAREEALHETGRLDEPSDPQPGSIVREPELRVVGGRQAGSQSEFEPAAGEDVERRRLAGEDERVAVVAGEDEAADPQRRRRGRRRGERDEWRELTPKVVRHEERAGGPSGSLNGRSCPTPPRGRRGAPESRPIPRARHPRRGAGRRS